jgi:hypothetical protein
VDNPGTLIDPLDQAGDQLFFGADAVTLTQSFPAWRGSASVEPITRLMTAILIDAVRCFQRNFEEQRREFRDHVQAVVAPKNQKSTHTKAYCSRSCAA